MNHSNDRSSVNTPTTRQLDGPQLVVRTDCTATLVIENLRMYSKAAGIVAEGYGLGISVGDF
ncbi:MAG: hypothetical protein IPI60_18040 [Saprospiraceae bacterium]|nr:hypothetical protein [Saprospiraceae bacterium]